MANPDDISKKLKIEPSIQIQAAVSCISLKINILKYQKQHQYIRYTNQFDQF